MSAVSRRGFLRLGGAAAVAAVPVGAATLAALVTTPPKRLPRAETGSVLTAASWNAVIDRLNELSELRR